MKTTAPLPKTRLPATPKLASKSRDDTPGYGEDGTPAEEQAAADVQAAEDQFRAVLARHDARYAGSNMYDFINAKTTL